MINTIYEGYIASKAGKFYLFSFAVFIIANIVYTSPAIHTQPIAGIGTIIFYVLIVISTIGYIKYLNLSSIWMFILILLIFIPMGAWINFIYLSYKTYNRYS